MDRVETTRVGISGKEPLYNKTALMETRAEFIKQFKDEPTQLRVSPKSLKDLRAAAPNDGVGLWMAIFFSMLLALITGIIFIIKEIL